MVTALHIAELSPSTSSNAHAFATTANSLTLTSIPPLFSPLYLLMLLASKLTASKKDEKLTMIRKDASISCRLSGYLQA